MTRTERLLALARARGDLLAVAVLETRIRIETDRRWVKAAA